MFHHESPGSITKNKRKGRRSNRRPHPAVQSPPLTSTTVPQMPDGKQNPSVCLLLHRFAAALPDGLSYGFLTFLPELYGDAATDRCMVQAAEAFAHAYLAKDACGTRSKSPQWLYCAALQATKLALSSPGKATTDVSIATVWLLGTYEASFTITARLVESALCSRLTDHIRCWLRILLSKPSQTRVPGIIIPKAWRASFSSAVRSSSKRDEGETSSGSRSNM